MIKPTERPIALTAQEVNAVLARNKTQHRVPVDIEHSVALTYHSLEAGGASPERIDALPFECPFGAIGDRLWVQEPTHTANSWDWFYDATHSLVECKDPYTPSDLYLPWDDDHQEYTGPIGAEHMPYWANRLLLEITDIRIERLNDISEQDAIAQGIKYIHADPKDRVGPNHFTKSNGWYHCNRPTAAEVFKEMYTVSDDYDKYGENPWVWVIEFKVVEPSEVQGG